MKQTISELKHFSYISKVEKEMNSTKEKLEYKDVVKGEEKVTSAMAFVLLLGYFALGSAALTTGVIHKIVVSVLALI